MRKLIWRVSLVFILLLALLSCEPQDSYVVGNDYTSNHRVYSTETLKAYLPESATIKGNLGNNHFIVLIGDKLFFYVLSRTYSSNIVLSVTLIQ